MNDLNKKTANLKKTIFKISNNPNKSNTQNQDLSFKTFVQVALQHSIDTLAQRFMHYGLPPSQLRQHIATGEALVGFEGTQDDLKSIDFDAVVDAINLYSSIVKENDPFEDILSLLAQDILLTRGRGKAKGQFMTPPEIAKLTAKLIYTPKEENKPHKFCDPCVGYGALMLAHLWNQHKEDPESLKNVEIIVNDIDPFMCHVSALQILMSTTQHNIDIKSFLILCSNAITQYTSGDTSFLLNYKTPEIVFTRIKEIKHFKLWKELMDEVLITQPQKPEVSVGAV